MIRKTGILLSLTLALIVASAAACGGGDDDDPSPSGSSAPARKATRERDGIRLTLEVDKAVYGRDDTVAVRVEAENTTDAAVEYHGAVPQEPGFSLMVVSDLAGEKPLGEPDQQQISGSLAGGAKISLEREWDKRLPIKDSPPTAPPGRYTVTARLLMAKAGFADLIEVAAAVDFEIEGTDYVQPPVDALAAAIKDPEVKAWVEARGENMVCAYPPRGLFYNSFPSTGKAVETFDFIYKDQLNQGKPICGIGTEGNAWRFVTLAAQGPEPSRLTVLVALGEPTVLSVLQAGPTPFLTPTPAP